MTVNDMNGRCGQGCPSWMCLSYELSEGQYEPCEPLAGDEPDQDQ